MTSKDRIKRAIELKTADRVPVMCQLSLGHYFKYSGIDPLDIWYSSEGFAEALIKLKDKYSFDGILVNLPGRDPNIDKYIDRKVATESGLRIDWKNGGHTIFPQNDNPHYFNADGLQPHPDFSQIDPEKLFYVEPWDITEIKYPYTWGFEKEVRSFDNYFPGYHFKTITNIIDKVGSNVSVHSEIFSPWSQFMELLNYENALMAILCDPEKVKSCLESLTQGAIALGKEQAQLGVDAILISSAFAGAGLISRRHYEEFVLPFEKKVISEIQKVHNVPVYTHTCGSIGDRLDLMMDTGTNGIDTLDPPPIGSVDLKEAKTMFSGKVFIKGNIDPINTLLNGTKEEIEKDVRWRLETGAPGGGYILSSACSVAPDTPPESIELLAELAEKFGRY